MSQEEAQKLEREIAELASGYPLLDDWQVRLGPGSDVSKLEMNADVVVRDIRLNQEYELSFVTLAFLESALARSIGGLPGPAQEFYFDKAATLVVVKDISARVIVSSIAQWTRVL